MFQVLYAIQTEHTYNILLLKKFLKAGNGWSDEEMHDIYSFDTQATNALGIYQLGEEDFVIRSI